VLCSPSLQPRREAAATILFDFSGTCEVDCARFGLNDGDSFHEAGALGVVDGTDISAGSVVTDVAAVEFFNPFGIDFLADTIFSADPMFFVADGVIGSFILNSVGPAGNAFCYNVAGSFCAGGRFDTVVSGGDVASGFEGHGPAVFTLVQAVPEPATAVLFGGSLLALSAFRRRLTRR
jgi:hypothetical protein